MENNNKTRLHKKLEWKNTYLPKDYFKILLISDTKESAQAAATWLTGSNISLRGIYTTSFKKTQMMVYIRWLGMEEIQPVTLSIEIMLLVINDINNWNKFKEEVSKHLFIPVKALISEVGEFECFKEININFIPNNDAKETREFIDELDKNEFNYIKK